MDTCDMDAIRILKRLYDECWEAGVRGEVGANIGRYWLASAIHRLAHPDRARYPKTRRGTKRHPVELRHE